MKFPVSISPANRERLKAAGEVAGGFLFSFMIFNAFQYFFNPSAHPEFALGSQSFITLLVHEYPQLLVAAGGIGAILSSVCNRRGDGGAYGNEMWLGFGLGMAESFLDKGGGETIIGGVIGTLAIVAEGRRVIDDFIYPKVAYLDSGVPVMGAEEI